MPSDSLGSSSLDGQHRTGASALLSMRAHTRRTATHKHGRRARVGLHLIGDEDGHVELLADAREARQHLVELLLALRQLASAAVVDAEEGEDAVDDEEAVRGILGKLGGEDGDEVHLCVWLKSLSCARLAGKKGDARCSLLCARPTTILSRAICESRRRRNVSDHSLITR